jgi:hypothetical protein
VGKFPAGVCVVQVAYRLRPAASTCQTCARSFAALFYDIVLFQLHTGRSLRAGVIMFMCAPFKWLHVLWVIMMACVCRTKGMCAVFCVLVAYFFDPQFIAPHFSTSFLSTKDVSFAWSIAKEKLERDNMHGTLYSLSFVLFKNYSIRKLIKIQSFQQLATSL